MSTWAALNVEPEDVQADEIDDTKEIQLEEAFKLYQNALRLHSLGPDHFAEARGAYEELFQSEVFKYPEATSEFDQEQQDEAVPLSSTLAEPSQIAIIPGSAAEASANSLPQLVYLAYKSRAQFVVDVARYELGHVARNRLETYAYYVPACHDSLKDSAKALERDDTDLDLWKKAARVSELLNSQRIVRFCLESVLAGDDEGDQTIDLSGLDEAFAKGELEEVLQLLQDDLSCFRTVDPRPRELLLNMIRKTNDPFPFFPRRAKTLEYTDDRKRPLVLRPKHTNLLLSASTQTSLGQALLQTFTNHQNGTVDLGPGAIVSIDTPTSSRDSVRIMTDAEMPDTTIIDAIDSPASFHSANEKVLDPTTSEAIVISGEQSPAVEEAANPDDTIIVHESKPIEEVSLPTRKRSSTAAGNDEPEARTKSRRIRARESMAELAAQEEETIHDGTLLYRDQLGAIEVADDAMLKVVNSMLSRIDVSGIGDHEYLHKIAFVQENDQLMDDTAPFEQEKKQALVDLRRALLSWSDEKSSALTSGHGARDVVEKTTGLSLFLKHSKATMSKQPVANFLENEDSIDLLLETINSNPMNITHAMFEWLVRLLTTFGSAHGSSSYLRTLWSQELKQIIVQIITTAHEQLVSLFETWQSSKPCPSDKEDRFIALKQPSEATITDFAQTMFELHLDIHSEITNPASSVDVEVRQEERYRLEKWAQLATDLAHQSGLARDLKNIQVLRFLWASAAFAKQTDNVDKDHILICLQDLRDMLTDLDIDSISLPNNAIMPQISVEAVEQEISRLNTLDFFMSVFDSDNSNPVTVIEKLEPILEQESVEQSDVESRDSTGDNVAKFRTFLAAGDASLTLFLWRKLQNAYTAISYNPKIVSCLFRSLETITTELMSERFSNSEEDERQLSLLRWLRDADDLVAKIWPKIADEPKAFESMDESHLRSSMNAVTTLLSLVQIFAMVDDGLRMGQLTTPSLRSSTATKLYDKCRDRLREFYVRLWALLYMMFKEAITQMPSALEQPAEDLMNYLRCVHNCLGERQYCRHSNKVFIRLTKKELLNTKSKEDYSIDMAQVLFDLYQIRLSSGFGDANHGCQAESLDKDKRTAHSLVPIIMRYARRLNIRDLLKSELKGAIEKLNNAIGQFKSNPALSYNRKAINSFLKAPIRPQDLYKSLSGIGEIMTKTVHGDSANVAAEGWYMLLGTMTLAKYKSVKRVNPTPTDELDNAATYLRQDLEHSTSNWEAWYRLAQVYDAKIEDNLTWNSTKINDARGEIATLERSAIHAYTMAIATAMRSADDNVETTHLINDMFSDFAMRLYSSSRPPLDMQAFVTDKAVRYLSSPFDGSMSKIPLIQPMRDYSVWSFAAYLLRQKISDRRKSWLCNYTLGKCLWKMIQSKYNSNVKHPVTVGDVIDAFSVAVETVPKKEKSSDPILEPHFKLVSIVHKLKDRQLVQAAQGVEYLQATSYAKGVHLGEDDQGEPEWESYMLAILKKLQTADKSNWHHRIIARAAHVIYDTEQGVSGALGAKHQFTQQMFTKTMTMQVWKPEFERPGRHYVYTGRYLRFFVGILDQLNDRSNLEQVIRRIRRKTTDFIDHTRVWEETVMTYVNMLRRHGKIPDGRERALFDSISFDEFTKQSEKLEKWAHDPETTTSYLDIMQDAIELKKLNNSLMKGSAVDDLIGDTYACMYDTFVSQLPPEEQTQPVQSAPLQGTFINMTTENAPTGDDNLDRMRLNNLLTSQTDGTAPTGVQTSSVHPGTGLGIQTSSLAIVGTPPPATDIVRVPAPAKPGRTKTITRREVQRKAEAAIVKPPPIKTPTLTKRTIIDVLDAKRSDGSDKAPDEDDKENDEDFSRLNSRQPSLSARDTPDVDDGDAEDEADGDADGEGGADDESELSEIEEVDEEDKEKKSAFTHLAARKRKAEDTEEQDDSNDDKASPDVELGGEDEDDEEEDDDDDDEPAEIPDSQGLPDQE